MARRRKHRTHLKGGVASNPGSAEGVPKSFVIKHGQVGSSLAQLVRDVRKVMEPNTASRLRGCVGLPGLQVKERARNKLRDFLTMAPALGVTHLLAFTLTDVAPSLRIVRLSAGPTLSFRVERYSLTKDIINASRRARSMSTVEYLSPPLVSISPIFSPHNSSPDCMTTLSWYWPRSLRPVSYLGRSTADTFSAPSNNLVVWPASPFSPWPCPCIILELVLHSLAKSRATRTAATMPLNAARMRSSMDTSRSGTSTSSTESSRLPLRSPVFLMGESFYLVFPARSCPVTCVYGIWHVSQADHSSRLLVLSAFPPACACVPAPVPAPPADSSVQYLSGLACIDLMYNVVESPVGLVPVTHVRPTEDALTAEWTDVRVGRGHGSPLVERLLYGSPNPLRPSDGGKGGKAGAAAAGSGFYNAEKMAGLPVGVQVVGRRWEDEKVVEMMRVVDRALGPRDFGPLSWKAQGK
ncbi:hypothetical protein ONZ51_g48 [Trametes cubensis]|uniref:Brix domain-containing protein n=1 Tax=Trametes cubensis TaxID=1111947 RepID=A0AAD7XH70_9APHY|nr:hypothetical protein ONZ51_g48 [Trametes cubensis]